MTDETTPAAPTAVAIARAIAVANGHPDPDTFVLRFEQALDGKAAHELPDYEPATDEPEPEPVPALEAPETVLTAQEA